MPPLQSLQVRRDHQQQHDVLYYARAVSHGWARVHRWRPWVLEPLVRTRLRTGDWEGDAAQYEKDTCMTTAAINDGSQVYRAPPTSQDT